MASSDSARRDSARTSKPAARNSRNKCPPRNPLAPVKNTVAIFVMGSSRSPMRKQRNEEGCPDVHYALEICGTGTECQSVISDRLMSAGEPTVANLARATQTGRLHPL